MVIMPCMAAMFFVCGLWGLLAAGGVEVPLGEPGCTGEGPREESAEEATVARVDDLGAAAAVVVAAVDGPAAASDGSPEVRGRAGESARAGAPPRTCADGVGAVAASVESAASSDGAPRAAKRPRRSARRAAL